VVGHDEQQSPVFADARSAAKQIVAAGRRNVKNEILPDRERETARSPRHFPAQKPKRSSQ